VRLAAGGKEWIMKKLRVLAAVALVAVAGLAIWLATSGPEPGGAAANNGDAAANSYDYEARDVIVRQMGPDGALQYELEAKQITQLPRDGHISAQQLVMRHDPAGSPAGEARLTLTADRADLPEAGAPITLQGKVHAQGRQQGSQALISLNTEQLTYNLATQDIVTDKPVDLAWGSSRFRCGDLRMNIKLGTRHVESECNGTFYP
jgi:LPS export ABC transporter protein LptC